MWNLRFSSRRTRPAQVIHHFFHLVAHESGAMLTLVPRSSRVARHGQQAHGFDHLALGRPRWDMRTILPLVHGILNRRQASRIRESSVMFPSSSRGTLKSTRIHPFRLQVQLDGPNTHIVCPLALIWSEYGLCMHGRKVQKIALLASKISPLQTDRTFRCDVYY